MQKPRVNSLLAALFLVTPFAAAEPLRQEQRQMLDRLMEQQLAAAKQGRASMNKMDVDLMKEVDELENKILPVTLLVTRAIDALKVFMAGQSSHIASLKARREIDPYEDRKWKAQVEEEMITLCCLLRSDPERVKRVRERLMRRRELGLMQAPPSMKRPPGLGPPAGPGAPGHRRRNP